MALQIRRGTNAERLGITLVEGEVVYVTDFELTTIEVTSINATTNVLTTTLNHGLAVNNKIRYMGTTTNGLTEGAVYFVKAIPSQTEFTLSTTQGGTILDITGTAAGLQFATGPTDGLGVPYGYSISPLYVGDGVTAGGNPAGAGILDDLYDVTIGVYGNVGQYGIALGNNHVLQYNDITNQWENRADLTLNGVAYLNGDSLFINYDATETDSNVYFKGTSEYIRYNNSTGYFEFTGDIARESVFLSSDGTQGTLSTGTGPLNLNTPSGQPVNVQRNLVVGGDLTVNGTTTTVNSTTLTVDDKNIELGSVATPSDTTADGGGITLRGATDKTILWQNANDWWRFNQHVATDNDLYLNTAQAARDVAINFGTTGALADNRLYWNNSIGRFQFTHSVRTDANLGVAGNIVVNADFSDNDATILFYKPTSGHETLIWNKTNGRFEFSDALYADGNLTINGSNASVGVATVGGTANIFNENALTVNVGNAATTEVNLGNTQQGRVQIKSPEIVGANTTQAVFNTVATTVNAFGAATTLNIGGSTGTTIVRNNLVSLGELGTNGNDIFFNYDDSGAANANIVVRRGAGNDIILRWNESTPAWEQTRDGSTFHRLPNQNLDATDSPSFAGATIDAVRIGVTAANEIDTTSGNLILDSASGTVLVDDDLTVNNNLQVNGTTTLGNATGDTVNLNSGTINIGTTLVSTTTIGDSATDTLAVNATSTFNNNLTVGSDSTDTLTVNSTSTFNNDVTLGSSSTDVLTVNSTAIFNNNVELAGGAGAGTVTIGNDATDELYVNATTYINNNLDIGSTTGDTLSVNSLVDTDIRFKDATATPRGVRGTVGTNDAWFVGGYAASTSDGQLIIATADDGTEPIYVRQYTGTILSGTITNELTLLNSSGDTRLPGELRIDGNTIRSSTDAIAITLSGANVTVAGDLTVNGTTTTINSTTLDVDDINITVAKGAVNAAAANGAGLTVDGAGATITYANADDSWNLNKDTNVTGALTSETISSQGQFFEDLAGDQIAAAIARTVTTTTTGITTLTVTNRKAMKIMLVADDGTDTHAIEALVMRDANEASGAQVTFYGELRTGAALATFTADYDSGSGNIRLRATPASATSTAFKVVRTALF